MAGKLYDVEDYPDNDTPVLVCHEDRQPWPCAESDTSSNARPDTADDGTVWPESDLTIQG